MKKYFKPLGVLLGSFILFLSGVSVAFGVPVSVPSAPAKDYYLVSTTTGAYVASSTSRLNIGTLYASSTTATSTFNNGIILNGGCLLFNGVCFSSGGSVTNIATTYPILGGPITTTGTISFGGLGTTSPFSAGQVAMVVNGNTITGVSTSTVTLSAPFTGSITGLGTNTFGYWGLSTTSQPASSNLLVSNGVAGVYGVATSSLGVTSPITFSGTIGSQIGGIGGSFGCATCVTTARNINTTWPLLGGGALSGDLTLTFGGLATSSPWTNGQVAYVSSGNSITSVATGTVSGAGVMSVTAGRSAIGGALSIDTTPGTFSGSGRYTFPQDLVITGNSTTTNATDTALYVSGGLTQGNLNGFISATTTKGFNIASTTLDAMGKSFNLGTSTFLLMNDPRPLTLIGFYCTASTTGTALVNFVHDNGNKTEISTCTSGGFTRTLTNNTWTANENFNVAASSTAGAVNRITITPSFYYTSN